LRRIAELRDHNVVRPEVHSYDWRGTLFRWRPPVRLANARHALDVEAKDTRGIEWLSKRYDLLPGEFLERWTATEVLAKLYDVPVLSWLADYGLASAPCGKDWTLLHGAWVRSVQHPTHCISIGVMTSEMDGLAAPPAGVLTSEISWRPLGSGRTTEGVHRGKTTGTRPHKPGPDNSRQTAGQGRRHTYRGHWLSQPGFLAGRIED
jgi:hypothetical protein